MKMYMAIDQYGHTYHGLKHPRKDLYERLCRSHVEKRRCNMVLVALLLFPVMVLFDCVRKNK